MANADFYNELDLRYPEIAICIDRIDRTNPGIRNFYIPVLTPNLDTSSLKKKEETIRLDSSIIANQDSVSISNVKIQNYIPIQVPKELCAFVGGEFNVVNVDSMTFDSSGTITISGTTTLSGGMTSHRHSTLEGSASATYKGKETSYKGILNIVPTDKYRYIEPGSKWIVVFIGGDIGKPQIIAPYREPAV